MQYLDFEIEIGPGVGRDYAVSVIRSPAGETRQTMQFPFDELELESHLDKVQIALLRSGGDRRRVPIPEQKAVQDFGLRLFDSLFSGEIRSLYNVSRLEAGRSGQGLRLKLRIQPPELAALPWEFLYDPREGDFVCLSTHNPLVRYLDVPQPLQPFTIDLPLRILGLIAAPDDLPPLNIPREKERVERAIGHLASRGIVELTWLEGQTWRDLQRALLGGPWHIFHFIGHGSFNRNLDEGLLALADQEGLTRHISATQLGRLLNDHTPMRLVVLNSCEGALGSERDVFSSTASILVRRGIPAVIAMQYEITDRAAIEFARAFYEALAFGMPVDAAVSEARKAISLAINNTVEWGTPILYLRAPDGQIFDIAGLEDFDSDPPTLDETDDADREKLLNELYIKGQWDFFNERWEAAERTFQNLVEMQPDYEDAGEKLEVSRRNARHGSLFEQGKAAREEGDWAEAVEVFQVLVDEGTQIPGVRMLLDDSRIQADPQTQQAERADKQIQPPFQASPPHGKAKPATLPTDSLAIISFAFSFAGFFALPFFGSLIGVITGGMAGRKIRNSGGTLGGAGWAKWGVILGWIGLALSACIFCAFIGSFIISWPEIIELLGGQS